MIATINNYKNRLQKIFKSGISSGNNKPGPQAPEYNIPEILPINCRESEFEGLRLNLLVPALSLRFSFGGINTALDFFSHLIRDEKDARIVITDETISDLKGFSQSSDWLTVRSQDPDQAGKLIVCFGDRYNKTIPVRKNDVFIATAWWTAYNGERILSWQREKWLSSPRPLIYLIQDFEPGFYKWSSRYLLAMSTYHQKNMIAVVNTFLLCDYIRANGISFTQFYIFEPTLNKRLSALLSSPRKHPKKKRILIYGRPSVERNAYEVILKALEYWSFWHPDSNNWEVISLGEEFANITLGNGVLVQVKGKVTLEEYAAILSDSVIGVSLMISPHPSYPPLEMAAFDLAVITNTFFNKNLSDYHDNIFSLENINPENIAIVLGELCKKFEDEPRVFENKQFRNTNFLNSNNTFPFIEDLKKKVS